ncbi:MAG TPA: hypothetical protein VEC37_11865 [Bacillota bacterium]|nr:hypothetical protein [Bacillota bacterium]
MADNPVKINSEEMGKLFAEKFKNLPKGTDFAEAIPRAIMEIIETLGIELPQSVKEKINEIQAKAQIKP